MRQPTYVQIVLIEEYNATTLNFVWMRFVSSSESISYTHLPIFFLSSLLFFHIFYLLVRIPFKRQLLAFIHMWEHIFLGIHICNATPYEFKSAALNEYVCIICIKIDGKVEISVPLHISSVDDAICLMPSTRSKAKNGACDLCQHAYVLVNVNASWFTL